MSQARCLDGRPAPPGHPGRRHRGARRPRCRWRRLWSTAACRSPRSRSGRQRPQTRFGSSPPKRRFSSAPARSCDPSRSIWRSRPGHGSSSRPGFSAAVVERCKEQDVLVIPGVATATEIDRRSRPRPRPPQVLPGGGGRRRRAPSRAAGAVPRRPLRPDRRSERSECGLVPRAAVRGRSRRQLDGRAGADRGPGLRGSDRARAGSSQPRRRGGAVSGLDDPPGRGVPLRPRRAR